MVLKERVKQNYFKYCSLKTCRQRSNNNVPQGGRGKHHLCDNFTPLKYYRNFIWYRHENKSEKRGRKLPLMNWKTS